MIVSFMVASVWSVSTWSSAQRFRTGPRRGTLGRSRWPGRSAGRAAHGCPAGRLLRRRGQRPAGWDGPAHRVAGAYGDRLAVVEQAGNGAVAVADRVGGLRPADRDPQ